MHAQTIYFKYKQLYMSIITTLDTIANFEGKRNTVLTLFCPPHTRITDFIDAIQRRVKCIRHKNKRWQINTVLRHIQDETEDIRTFDNNGAIICAGMTANSKLVCYILYPPKKISSLEYYYGYKFDMSKIQNLWYSDVIKQLESEEEKLLLQKINNSIINDDKTVALGEEVDQALDMGIVKQLLYFDTHDIDTDLINRCRATRTEIIRCNMNMPHAEDFSDKFGLNVGVLRYTWMYKS